MLAAQIDYGKIYDAKKLIDKDKISHGKLKSSAEAAAVKALAALVAKVAGKRESDKSLAELGSKGGKA